MACVHTGEVKDAIFAQPGPRLARPAVSTCEVRHVWPLPVLGVREAIVHVELRLVLGSLWQQMHREIIFQITAHHNGWNRRQKFSLSLLVSCMSEILSLTGLKSEVVCRYFFKVSSK